MNFNDNFNLKKAKSFLLSENYQMDEMETLDEMASFYSIKPDVDEDEAKEAIAAVKAKYRPGTAFYQTLDALEKTGEVDYKALAKETGKDIATWNKPETRNVLEKDGPLAQYLNASSSPLAVRTGRPKVEKGEEGEEKLDENEMLDEMATFYKIKPGMEDEAKEVIATVKAKLRPGTNFYNTLDSLETTGEVDYQKLAKETGKDVATWNNPTTRGVLEKDGPLAQFLDAGSSPSAVRTGRPKGEKGEEMVATAAPAKPKADTIKITPSKTTSTSAEKAPVKAASTERDLAQEIKDAEAEVKKLGLAALKSQDPKDMAKAKEATAKLKALRAEVK
jgi:hypothetical protein